MPRRRSTIDGSALASFSLSLLLGWLAGGAANWAADVLPHARQGTDAPPPSQRAAAHPTGALAPLHYLTLPWYATRRGACPHCGQARPVRAPLLEAGAILVFLVAWWRFRAAPLHLAVVCLYAAQLLAVMAIDFEQRRVLNVMLAPAAAAALLLSPLPGGPGLLPALLGGVFGLVIFALIALIGRGKLGAGDVKLAGVIGLMTGYPAVVHALLLGVIIGGIAALILVFSRRVTLKQTIAYAPYLALGALVMLLV